MQYNKLQKELLVMRSKIKGFSLIELLIVLIISGVILTSIAFRTSGAISNMGAEAVVAELALAIHEAKDGAASGSIDLAKTSFSLNEVLERPHNGVTVTTRPTITSNDCNDGCNSKTDEISICVSGNNFCFIPSETFSFERFSGRLKNAHAIFINSDKRKMAILITQSGDHYIAELIDGSWRSQKHLQNLFPKTTNVVKQAN